jgi:tetratricopeptide (TPR) repeat protein
MLAGLLSLEDRYTESLQYFRDAKERVPQSEVVHFSYAYALAKAGQADLAIEEYLKALRIDPIFHEAHYNLALLYIQKADYVSAVQHLNNIVSLEAANIPANMKLAEIYASQGKLPLARQHLQQVLKADPQDREALSLFARIGG